MNTCPPRQPQRRCLLPFEAEPQAVGRLRRAVGVELAAWGAAVLSDAVTLAVSELATNVIRHVGQGTPATLMMETYGDCLRIELHDISPAMPRYQPSSPRDETGRGLALIAAVSDRWFAKATAGGKAVCCEFTAQASPKTCDHHITRGAEAIQRHAQSLGVAGNRPPLNRHAIPVVATSLITDVLYWLVANGQDPDAVLTGARAHFDAEDWR